MAVTFSIDSGIPRHRSEAFETINFGSNQRKELEMGRKEIII